MIKNIIKLALYAVLIVFCDVTHNTFAMQRFGNLAKQLPTKTRAPQPRPTTAPGQSFPTSQQPAKSTITSQSTPFGKPGKNIPPGLSKSTLQPGRSSFQSASESFTTSIKPVEITFNTSPFLEGNILLKAIEATTKVDISNPIDEKQIEQNILKAINGLQNQGFTVFLVPKNAGSFLRENQLIPQEQAQWLTQEVSGKAYTGSIKLDNGNVIVVTRSGASGLYGIADPAIKTMADYLQNFHIPETTKDLKLRNSAALLASELTNAYKYTQKQVPERLLSESIVLEQPLEVPLPQTIEKPEIKPEDKEPELKVVKPVAAIPIPPKQPIQAPAEFPSQKEIKDITKVAKSPADIIEPHKEAEDHATELAEEKRFQEAEKARLEKELPEIVNVEYEAFEKELAEKQEISQLERELIATNQKIATNEQEYQEALTKIAQETEKINADLDQELVEFEKKQLVEKEQAIAQAKAEAKRITAVNNLDTEQQDKLFKRLENNYQEKIAQDLASKKQTIEAEKNKKIETAKTEIKNLEAQQEKLEEKQKFLKEKIQEQESLSLEIIEGAKILADMTQKQQENELLLAQIRQNTIAAKEKFSLEKGQIEAEFNQKLLNSQNENIEKLQKNKEELRKNISFIHSDMAQQEQLLERLEKNLLIEFEETKNTLKKQKNKKIEEIEQLEKQEIKSLLEEQKQLEQKHAQLKFEQEKHSKELAQKLAQEEQDIQQMERKAEETFQNKKNELEEQKKVAQHGLADKDKSAQEEIEDLEQKLKKLVDDHVISEELLKKQKNRVEQAQAEMKEIEQQQLQAKKDRAKEAQEKVLKLRKEAADKKAELEQANLKTEQTQKTAEQTGKDIVQAEKKQEDLKKLLEQLEREIAQEKKELSEEEQKKLLLEQQENEKKVKAEQAKQEQEIAEKEELRLKAEKAAEEARVQEQAAQEAAEKAAKDLDNAIKEQQKQEQLLKEKEEEKIPKVGMQQPTVPPFQGPLVVTQEPVLLGGQVSKTSQPQPIITPPFQAPSVRTEEPVFLGGEEPKISGKQPSPISIPAVEIKEPMIERIEQAKPEPKPIKKPMPPISKRPIVEPIEYQQSPIKPTEPIIPEQTRGSSGAVDMDPLSLTPFKPRPFPELELKTFDPYFYPRSGSASRTAPTPSYGGISSSGSSEWPTPEQPQAYLPEVKTKSIEQVTPRKRKLSPAALVLLERLLPQKESDSIKPQATQSKGIGAWLRGLSLLQQQHAAARKTPQSEKKETATVTKPVMEKPNRVATFIQNVTTVIKDTVSAVIDTIVSSINQVFFGTG